MSIIKEVCKKYNGEYEEESKKVVNTIRGQVGSQFIRGRFIVDGQEFELAITRDIGVSTGGGPYRLTTKIENKSAIQITIYQKSNIDKAVDLLKLNKDAKSIFLKKSEFKYVGDQKLINRILEDKGLYDLMKGSDIGVYVKKAKLSTLMLKPMRGIHRIEEVEKYIEILRLIRIKIDAVPNTT